MASTRLCNTLSHFRQVSGAGLGPLLVEKRTWLMQLLSDAFSQKAIPVVAVNVTDAIASLAGTEASARYDPCPIFEA